MAITQLSVFVENKSGRLASIAELLASNNVNLRALSIADTDDFGVLRVIVDDTEKAQSVLSEAGIAVKRTSVIAVAIDDIPGGLSKILSTISNSGLVIEYMYAFVGKSRKKAITVIRTDDMEATASVLSQNGIHVLDEEDVENI